MFCSWARVPRVLGPLDVEEDVEVEVEVEVAVEEEDDDDGFALRPRLFLVFAVFFFFLLEGMVFSRFCLAASLLSMCSRGEFRLLRILSIGVDAAQTTRRRLN